MAAIIISDILLLCPIIGVPNLGITMRLRFRLTSRQSSQSMATPIPRQGYRPLPHGFAPHPPTQCHPHFLRNNFHHVPGSRPHPPGYGYTPPAATEKNQFRKNHQVHQEHMGQSQKPTSQEARRQVNKPQAANADPPSGSPSARNPVSKKREGENPPQQQTTKEGNSPPPAREDDVPWEEQYTKIKIFFEDHQHCVVPGSFGGKKLANWYSNQKRDLKNGTMRADRVELLRAIKFGCYVTKWNIDFSKLQKFKADNNDGRCMPSSTDSQNHELFNWAKMQKIKLTNNHKTLTAEMRQKLMDHFDLNPEIESAKRAASELHGSAKCAKAART
ncbi:helicase [Seminavis robusta]|uniref:Helicase n=1 Tax=Seminavis robusta TaxID=568900 RepID=A0A9N8ENN4_9STRA|nr:helicase [Seminavis robusta]|eukprot:Sro1482_g276330.1 helicase (331) ;mRNA; f:26675-27667